MSAFLGFSSVLIPAASTVAFTKNAIITELTAKGWQEIAKGKMVVATLGTWGTVANFFDNNNYLVGGSASWTTGMWAGVQLFLTDTVTSYKIMADWGNPHYTPSAWALEYSDDGVTWATGTPADTQTAQTTWYGLEERTYTVGGSPGNHLYWRIKTTGAGQGTNAWAAQIRFILSDGSVACGTNAYSYLQPPVANTIGNATAKDLVLMTFNSTTINVLASQQYLLAIPQFVTLYQKTAGAVACAVSLPTHMDGTFNITASQSGTTLTVTATAGVLAVGSNVYGPGMTLPSVITTQLTGSAGSTGTYTLTSSATVSSATMKATGGITITGAAGTAGSTAVDNLRALYVALRNSANTSVADWVCTYQIPTPQNATDTNTYIQMVRTTNTIPALFLYANTNTNLVYPSGGLSYGLQSQGNNYLINHSMTIDLANGFNYYIQINNLGFAMATKTNVSYYGPQHACYVDHTKALAAMPVTIDSRFITPIELFTGFDGAATTSCVSYASPAKFWGMSAYQNSTFFNPTLPSGAGSWAFPGHPLIGCNIRDNFHDCGTGYTSGTSSMGAELEVPLAGSGVFLGQIEAIGDDFQIHKMVLTGTNCALFANGVATSNFNMCNLGGTTGSGAWVPSSDITDWYKFRGTVTNETLALVQDPSVYTTLNQAMDATTAYTTLTLTDVSELTTAGVVIIENEAIAYTGKSGSTITGVTRAQYGTSMNVHYVGDKTYQGLWFVLINGGALLAGYVKPT